MPGPSSRKTTKIPSNEPRFYSTLVPRYSVMAMSSDSVGPVERSDKDESKADKVSTLVALYQAALEKTEAVHQATINGFAAVFKEAATTLRDME